MEEVYEMREMVRWGFGPRRSSQKARVLRSRPRPDSVSKSSNGGTRAQIDEVWSRVSCKRFIGIDTWSGAPPGLRGPLGDRSVGCEGSGNRAVRRTVFLLVPKWAQIQRGATLPVLFARGQTRSPVRVDVNGSW